MPFLFLFYIYSLTSVNILDMKTNTDVLYKTWLENATDDLDLVSELKSYAKDKELLNDAFYKDLSFGTAGLRGVIGAGTNRINIYVVRKVSQGLANYVLNHFKKGKRAIAISYDSRIKSDVFAKTAAEVFAANGIKVFIYKELMPTPCLSFAVRELKCSAGIMVTASHNPAKYNGYKVYNDDGCQITEIAAEEIQNEIKKIDPFKDVKYMKFEDALASKQIKYISDKLITKFINRVKKESVLGKTKINKDVKIVYSPLHGTGLKPVTRILKETGFNNVVVVNEQALPDGNFTTCPFPNPEIREAMELGIKYAKKENADLLIATDPDADRVGIAVKDGKEFKLLSGNQTGVLLLNFICELRKQNRTMPKNAYVVKSLVSTDLADKIAKHHKVNINTVLTGFKYIGEFIKTHEGKKSKNYIFGFEESYGYLSGGYVRDKDAVDGAFLIAEMFAYYKTKGISLCKKLDEIYKKYGYYVDKVESFYFEGQSGFNKMSEIMSEFRKGLKTIGKYKITKVIDYSKGVNGLPKADVIKFILENGSSVVIRPSGTEPKLKMYCSVTSSSLSKSNKIFDEILENLSARFK